MKLSRREMINWSARSSVALAFASCWTPLLAAPETRRFKIGACDWSIGKTADPGAFEIAKEIGLDGLQVSLGTAADYTRLCKSEAQKEYREAAKKTGVAAASLAIGELNNVPYKSDPRAVDWVNESIDVCTALDVRVVLLAFFVKGDLRDDKAGTDEVVRRLKIVAPKAEKSGRHPGPRNLAQRGAAP